MTKNTNITVKGSKMTIIKNHGDDYISLTDMVRSFEGGLALIEKWLRNKNTIEFIGIWEQINNPSFNSPEFEGIRTKKYYETKNNCQENRSWNISATKRGLYLAYRHRAI